MGAIVHKDSDKLVGFLCRHLVPVEFVFSKGALRASKIISAFALSVDGQWFLITAGHCITVVNDTLTEGYAIERCRLLDYFGIGSVHSEPIPFDFRPDTATSLSMDATYDYGLFFLNDLQVAALQANGIVAIDERAWDLEPAKVDRYAVLGVPKTLSRSTPDQARENPVLIALERLAERPEGFAETDAPTFWARITGELRIKDIDGMSGGPVFSLVQINGHWKYYLHAVQSRWLPTQKLVAACETRPLATFLKEFKDGKHRHLVKGQETISG